MDFKPPLTISEQLDYIEKKKRVKYNSISKEDASVILEKYGYINVITPFKHLFAKRNEDGEIIKDIDGNHIYEHDVDFKQYYDAYLNERKNYQKIYTNINKFETTFNAIVAYECIHYYDLRNSDQVDFFISNLQYNISHRYDGRKRERMFSSVTSFRNKISEFDSIYILMDRLTLNEVITVYRCVDYPLQHKIFRKLLQTNCTLQNTREDAFDKMLDKIVQIRNCVYHENSLTVLVRYFNIRNKLFRDKTSRSSYNNLIKKLSQ